MNHIYRLVWNHLGNTWVWCAENARGSSNAQSNSNAMTITGGRG